MRTCDDWLEIHRTRDAEGREARTVHCPYRGACPVSVCVACKDFETFALDGSGWHSYVVCKKAEHEPNERQPLLERYFRDAVGVRWTVTVCGRQRHDGTWDGWLEWRAPDATMRYGGLEANARSRDALIAWAKSLSSWDSRGLRIANQALPKGQ
jgi:hypothetical protein